MEHWVWLAAGTGGTSWCGKGLVSQRGLLYEVAAVNPPPTPTSTQGFTDNVVLVLISSDELLPGYRLQNVVEASFPPLPPPTTALQDVCDNVVLMHVPPVVACYRLQDVSWSPLFPFTRCHWQCGVGAYLQLWPGYRPQGVGWSPPSPLCNVLVTMWCCCLSPVVA